MEFSRRTGTKSSIPPFVRGLALFAVAAGLVAGCARRPPQLATTERHDGQLRLLGAAAYPAGALALPDAPRFGSISGLARDARSGQWVGAIDETMPVRLAWMDIAFGPAITITPSWFTLLDRGPDVSEETFAGLELEALAAMPDGSFAVTTEGYHDANDVVHQPVVVFVQRDGTVVEEVHPRAHFTIRPGDHTWGVRHNLGLESLTRTPDGRLLSGLEQPLVQDGPMSSTAAGGVVRLLEFVEHPPTGWAPGREWAYQLEPTSVVPGYDRPCADGENGLSDMLALTRDRWLMLERACLLGGPDAPAYNPVRVFEATVGDAADVSGMPSLAGRQLRLVKKRLVLDVGALLPRLPPLLATGSNFEALALGPPGPRGERTVVLMSDDNLRPTQTTAVLWLALPK